MTSMQSRLGGLEIRSIDYVPLSERHGKVWHLGLGLRIVTVGFTALLSLIGALAATKNFLGNFNNFLLLILYLFIPWTAVNLASSGCPWQASCTSCSPARST